jgi:hypothetical protein
MPSTIKKLLESVGLRADDVVSVRWGQAFDETSPGIYFISTSSSIQTSEGILPNAPVDESILKFWNSKVKGIQIDGKYLSSSLQLKERLDKFWLPDENILYIGKADCIGGITKRVNQYYKTEIGERKPHAGGHWIKTLSNLNDLYVHFVCCESPLSVERSLLDCFLANVSSMSLLNHGDPLLPLPFANLEIHKRRRKKHGINNCKLSK